MQYQSIVWTRLLIEGLIEVPAGETSYQQNGEISTLVCYLPKASFAEHHDKVEIGELDAILVAVSIILGDIIGRRAVCILTAWTNPGSLETGRERC